MPTSPKALGALAVISCLGLSTGLAGDGGWKFELDKQDHPELSYLDSNGKTVLFIGCGHAFAIHAVYPGSPKKDEAEAIIIIANKRTQMTFKGEIESDFEDSPPNTTHFVQWDLGYRRQDPGLYEKRWHRLESRLFDLLDSGEPLTVSAEGKSYVLPAVNAPQWRRRFQKIC